MSRFSLHIVLLYLLINYQIVAQTSNPELRKIGYMDGNNISISFYNDGQISGFNIGSDLRGVWNGYNYIGAMATLVGLELPIKDYINDEVDDSNHSVIITRSPLLGNYDEKHPTENYFWGFNPLPGYMSESLQSPAMSDDNSTWPMTWPDHPEWGNRVWNGLNGPNNFSGDLETYFVMDDFWDDEFNEEYGFLPDPNNPSIKGHGIKIAVRFIQSNNPLYENIIFRVYDITNTSKNAYERMFWGNITGSLLGGEGDSQDEMSEFDAENNIVYAWDYDYTGNEGQQVGVLGESIIYGPNNGKIGSYNYYEYSNSPDMSNDEELWDRFSNIVPSHFIPMDGDHLYGSSYFSLHPGETKRIVAVLGLAYSKSEVQQNILYAKALWNANFDYDVVSSSVTISNLNEHRFLSGEETIEWDSQISGGTCDVLFSPDFGKTWITIESNVPNNGNYIFNTSLQSDCYFGKIKLFLKDNEGNLYGYDESNYFAINNEVDGYPQILIDKEQFEQPNFIVNNVLSVKLLAGDPETTNPIIKVYYSFDEGNKYTQIISTPIQSSPDYQTLNINLSNYSNSDFALVKLELTDGNNKSTVISPKFVKESTRVSVNNSKIEFISGFSELLFEVNIVDSNLITGDEYILTFNDTSNAEQIFLNVFNNTERVYVLRNSPIYAGTESQIFDGLSFSSEELLTEVDLDNSGWTTNTSSEIIVNIQRFSSNQREGIRMPNDYEITFYDEIVDTSVADTLYPPIESNIVSALPIKFRVKTKTINSHLKLVASKIATTTSTAYNIWFKEKINGSYFRTWRILFRINQSDYSIPSGNSYSIITKKGFSSYDSIKVLSLPVSVNNDMKIAKNYNLSQNYPNPFNPTTRIQFGLPKQSKVSLVIYNILGQQVEQLVNQELKAGYHEVEFNSSNVSSGIYFYRIQAGEFISTRKMLLMK